VPIGTPLADVIRQTLRGGFIKKESLSAPPKALETHCYYHPDRGVVARCVDCGKNLCRECADKYSVDGKIVPLCDDCFEHRREKRLKADREAAFAVLNEHEDKKRKFLIKFIISLVLFVIILVSLIDAREFGWTYLLLLLSFFPFGFMQGLAGLVEGFTPTVLYSDGTTDKGCLTGIILGLLGGIFGGLFIFIKDLFEILLFVKPEIPGDTQGTISLEARRKDEPVDKADVPKWYVFIMIGVIVLAFIFIYFAFFK
ncbi:MAG: hypothetical protein IJU08_03055, partial [Bacteroidales bacterium]|nr:hypothetical protein [Bacteroidales bacterium]MBQ9397454.1 hypothetical protein [Bacteroidales bacterium]